MALSILKAKICLKLSENAEHDIHVVSKLKKCKYTEKKGIQSP